jgi:DNA topoisomerase VI subunit A
MKPWSQALLRQKGISRRSCCVAPFSVKQAVALVTSPMLTYTRDMYYRDPELFMRQAVVDRYVDDLAYTFGVGRDALNVVGTHRCE